MAKTSEPRGTSRKLRTCLIAAPSEVDLDPIRSLLQEIGVKPITPFEEASLGGGTVTDHVARSIDRSDFVLAIVTGDAPSANVFFELGFAVASGKPVLTVVDPGSFVPADLAGLPVISARPSDRNAISFAVQQMVSSAGQTALGTAKGKPLTRPIGDLADVLIRRLEDLVADERGLNEFVQVEQVVREALEASGIETLVFSDAKDVGADMAIWSDELHPWLGNPVLVEIIPRLRERAPMIQSKMMQLRMRAGASWILLLYIRGNPSTGSIRSLNASGVLVMSVRALIEGMRARSFARVIRDLRNVAVHPNAP